MDSDRVILSSMLVTTGSTLGASVMPAKYGGQGGLPSTRLLVGTGLTYFGLSILNDFQPKLAGPIAAAIAVTAATYYGFPLLDNWFNGAHNKIPNTPKD